MTTVVDAIVAAISNRYKGGPGLPRQIVGVSGPQGSGKTTVTRLAAHTLTTQLGIPTVALSLDDFYWPYGTPDARADWGNPAQACRGSPGTHDTQLLDRFCTAFLSGQANLEAPTYDKSLHDGAGDRSAFVPVPEKTRVISLEGWMSGFKPVNERHVDLVALANDTVKPTEQGVHKINTRLSRYSDIWDKISLWIRLVPLDLQDVYIWRVQQEHDLIRARGSGMTDSEVRKFVNNYMPCYKLYTSTLDTLPASTIAFSISANHEAKLIK